MYIKYNRPSWIHLNWGYIVVGTGLPRNGGSEKCSWGHGNEAGTYLHFHAVEGMEAAGVG
jgi:hypothetical protein